MRGINKVWKWLGERLRECGREWWFVVAFMVLDNYISYHSREFTGSWLVLRQSMSVSCVLAWLLVMLYTSCRAMRWLKWVVYAAMVVIFATEGFLWRTFHTFLTPAIFTLLGETTGSESSEFLKTFALAMPGVKTAVTVLAAGAMIAVGEWLSPRITRAVTRRRWLMALASLAMLGVVVLGVRNIVRNAQQWASGASLHDTMVVNEERVNTYDSSERIARAMYILRLQRDEVTHFMALSGQVSRNVACTADADLCLVVVVGESYNKHHAAIYGYPLPTTPHMAAARDSGVLVAMTDVVAPYNTTSLTMKNMFSCNSLGAGERWSDYPFFTTLFKSAGYHVYYWDNQLVEYKAGQLHTWDLALSAIFHNPAIDSLSYSASNAHPFTYDADLVADFAAHHGNDLAQGRNLVVLHLMGQHVSYSDRYPDSCAHFTAADVRRNEPYITPQARQIIANYDNATLYNDAVLGEIFDLFATHNAVVVYLADHGEEVYDYRDFLCRDHALTRTPLMTKHENEVPLVLWFSPVYRQRHPDAVAQAQACSARPVSTDALAQLMLGLGHIGTTYYRAPYDPLSGSFTPQRRLIFDTIDYDALMRKQ